VYHAGRMRCLHWTLLVASLGFMPLVAGCAGACWGGYRNTGPGSFSRFFHSRWFLALGLYVYFSHAIRVSLPSFYHQLFIVLPYFVVPYIEFYIEFTVSFYKLITRP